MALLTSVAATLAGTTVTYVAAAAGGDTAQYSPNTELCVRNGSGAAVTVTVVVPGNTQFGQAEPDVPVSVPAGGEKRISLVRELVDPATGYISFTYSASASVTVALVQVP